MRFSGISKKLIALAAALCILGTAVTAEVPWIPQMTQMSAYAAEAQVLTVTGDPVNVRSGAGTNYEKVATVNKGAKFNVQGTAKDSSGKTWYKVNVNGKTGYILGTFCSVKAAQPATITITGDYVNVRSGPGKNYARLTSVKKGAIYNVYNGAKDEDGVIWYKLTIGDQNGYIIGTEVTLKGSVIIDASTATTASTTATTAQGGTTATTTATTAAAQKLTVTGDVVNVRKGAGTNHGKLTTVKRGATYTSQGTAKDSSGATWYKISINGTTGYILGTYVKVENTTTTTATTTTTTAASTQKLTVTGDPVNIRKGAGTTYAKLTTVKKGATFEVLGTAKDSSGKLWYKIKVNNDTGYILGDFAKVTGTPATTTTVTTGTTAAASTQKLTVTGDPVNIRKGAGTTYAKLTTVKKGATFDVLGTAKDSSGKLWYKIKVNNDTGYILGDFAKVTGTPATTATTTTTTATTGTTATTAPVVSKPAETLRLTVTGDIVNIRKGAGTNYGKLTTARKGATFLATGSTKDSSGTVWYTMNFNGQTGYIISTYVKVTSESSTTTTTTTTAQGGSSTAAQAQKLTVTGDVVNVRKGAGTNYGKLTTVKRGATYTVSGTATDSSGKVWYKIPVGSTTGYIISTYVKVENITTTASTTTTTTTASSSAATSSTAAGATTTTQAGTKVVTYGVVKTSSGSLNVRKTASNNGTRIGSLKKGTKVVIVETVAGGWYKIEYSSGYGYVSSKYITDVKSETVITTLTFPKSYYYVNQGSTVDVSIPLSGKIISYSSENSANAPVTYDGKVTGNVPGLYTITAKLDNLVATTEVVVLKKAEATVAPMTISEAGTNFIAQWEGGGTFDSTKNETLFYPYQDPVGYWTIGYGHAKTTADSKQWTKELAIAAFNIDITQLLGAEHILTDTKPYLTMEEAAALLRADLNQGDYVKSVSDWAVRNSVVLTQTQFDALVSFCYNLGPAYWTSDTYYFYLKSAIICQRGCTTGDKTQNEQIIDGFCRYIKASGVNLKGLWFRRRNEAELFLTGDYAIDRENKFTPPTGVEWT